MPTSGSDSQQNDVPVKLGMLVIAVILNFALYGYVLHQFLCYLEYRYKDSSRVRALLLALFILHTYHLSTLFYLVWKYCIIQFSTFKMPRIFLWPYSSSPIVRAAITSLTNTYMINRLYRLTGSKAQMICTAVPAVIAPVSGITVSIMSWTTTVYGPMSFGI
ncbi:hypothetical protein BC834DRAFT_970173 [Gloeopeniophorella convolvens]|nr:hypothetical protein BC834DRAFT_970173 [Gloeopeniophorella convolvens]